VVTDLGDGFRRPAGDQLQLASGTGSEPLAGDTSDLAMPAAAMMSAIERITDSTRTSRHVRFVPMSDICTAAKGRYSITASARSRNDSEIANPSTLAVLRLTTSSNLVGNSIGKSPGLAPPRIRCT
jgi:hypothetical protein